MHHTPITYTGQWILPPILATTASRKHADDGAPGESIDHPKDAHDQGEAARLRPWRKVQRDEDIPISETRGLLSHSFFAVDGTGRDIRNAGLGVTPDGRVTMTAPDGGVS